MGWNGQQRDAYALSWREAVRGLWPQTLFGVVLAIGVVWYAPGALPWAMPVLVGLTAAIPFALITASPGFGRATSGLQICAVPDDFAPHPSLRALDGRLPTGPLDTASRVAAE
ncbi:MAG: hypothetical protein AAFR46_14505 [Pseudomonadota bacterium]